jgi:hypothetical protein
MILNLLLFITGIILISFSISGLGRLLTYKFENNLFLDTFFGFIIVSFVTTFLHFFFRINYFVSFLLFLIGLISFFNKQNITYLKVHKNKFILYFFLILILIPIFISQKYHEDFGYYHLPYALSFIESKIIFGLSNLNTAYVYNSIWLNISSLFFIQNKNFDFLTLPNFLIFLSFILFTINNINNKKKIEISDYFLIIILFYFLLKFTRISEFGIDLPLAIYSLLCIYFFLKYFETNLLHRKKFYFFCNFTFSIFSVLIKLSSLPILLLTLFLYVKNFKKSKLLKFDTNYLFIYVVGLSFLIQQYIYTGCFIFPSEISCLNVSWFNSNFIEIKNSLELTNKSYSEARNIYTAEEYLNNFTWFSFWLKRNYIEILEHLMTIIIPISFYILCLKNRGNKNRRIFEQKKILIFFIILNLIFWLNFSPVYRFAIHMFVTFSFVLVFNFFINKKFSKKVFTFFFILCLIFSFSKNMKRIFEKDNIFVGIEKIQNEYIVDIINSKDYAVIFYPDVENNKKNGWQGRLCWDIPFMCSYNKININKKNNYLYLSKAK